MTTSHQENPMNLPEPHEEALGAALLAIRHARLPWYLRHALRSGSAANYALACETARRVEHRTRLLAAREIDTLDDPAWRDAILTAKQLILAKPGHAPVDEWWKRLPAFSGSVPQSPCPKCGAIGFGATSRYVRHTVRPAGCQSDAVFGEYLVRACGSCGFEWRERCADASEPQNGPQSDGTGPGDAVDAEAASEAHSAPKETGTGPSPAERADDGHPNGPESPQGHAEAPGRENTRDDDPEPGSVALVPAVTASGGFGDGNPHAKAAEA